VKSDIIINSGVKYFPFLCSGISQQSDYSKTNINMRTTSILALAGGAAAQNLSVAAGESAQFLASNPGGIIPAGVPAPSIAGFNSPTIQPSRGGLAICVSGIVPVQASTSKNLKFNFEIPKNQSTVTQTFVSMVTSGSPFTEQLMAGMQSVNGTYDIKATLCTPAGAKPDTVEILTHGIGFDRYILCVAILAILIAY
jgi:hypothetical protein